VRHAPRWQINFRLLWLGESVSLLGDQFYFIALPWLVFQMSGSALAFGTILMVAGVPRALFMLVGGVMTDRFSPRAVMTVSNLLRLIITVLLALVAAGQMIELWMLYVMAFCFGVVDAFFHPAYRRVPLIVDEGSLQPVIQSCMERQLVRSSGRAWRACCCGVSDIVVFDEMTFLLRDHVAVMHPKRADRDASPDATVS
jgi:hypothetical protein